MPIGPFRRGLPGPAWRAWEAEWRREREASLDRRRGYVNLAREEIGDPRARRRAPQATDFIGEGMQEGYVFATTKKNVVVRVGPASSLNAEILLTDPKFVGGVVKVYGLVVLDVLEGTGVDVGARLRRTRSDHDLVWISEDLSALASADWEGLSRRPELPDEKYVVTWKERISEFVEAAVYSDLPNDRALDILHALSGIAWRYDLGKRIRILKTWRGTRRFARALGRGMPTHDLDLSQNLGVTRKGRVVAFEL